MNLKYFMTWFQAHDMSVSEAQEAAEKAKQRALRQPKPVSWFFPINYLIVEYIFPLILMRRLTKASSLNECQIDVFEKKIQNNHFLFVRLIYLQIKIVLYEQLYAEPSCEREYTHPLTGKLADLKSDQKQFDVLVIGSGAGGAPVAWSLSRSGLKVGVIESGDIATPQGTAHALEHYYLKQGCTFSVQGGLVSSLAGNTLGGTTSINSGTCLRATKESLLNWDKKLGTKFSEGELDSYFEKVEKTIGVTTPPRSLLGPSAALIEKGLEKMGRSGAYVLPRCAPDCDGSGTCCFVCPTQAKRSTDLSYLPEAVDHGCKVFSKTTAHRIQETNEGVSVTVHSEGRKFELKARHLVISAGALLSPKLIRRNRLGSHWRSAGHHFRTHPATKVFAYFDKAFNEQHGVPQGLGYTDSKIERIVFEGVHTPPQAAAPLLQVAGKTHRWWMQHYNHLATFGFMLVDGHEGRVRHFGSWPILSYRLQPDDVIQLVRALSLTSEIFFAAGASKVLWPVQGMPNVFHNFDEIKQLDLSAFKSQNILTSGFHPQGTVAMGHVLDNNLTLKGCSKISVCDASILPGSPGVNPQVTIMAFALRLAEYLELKSKV